LPRSGTKSHRKAGNKKKDSSNVRKLSGDNPAGGKRSQICAGFFKRVRGVKALFWAERYTKPYSHSEKKVKGEKKKKTQVHIDGGPGKTLHSKRKETPNTEPYL